MADAGQEKKPQLRPRGPDRRQRPTPMLSRWSIAGGRRRGARRAEEAEGAFVDIYSLRVLMVLGLLLALNLLDAHFTLLFLARGGEEGNPFAVWLLEYGPAVLIAAKGLGVGLGALLFCMLKNFPNARLGVVLALGFYQLLLFYHLWLYAFAQVD